MFNSYFSGRYVLSLKALLSLVLSDRSDGKTFDAKVRILEDYKEGKKIGIYLRRFKTEITKKLWDNFFGEVLNVDKYAEYREWEFKYSKTEILVKTNKEQKEWDTIAFIIPLSMASKYKSQIQDYVKRIYTISFDEIIPLDLRYLKDEVETLLEFYQSVDRDRNEVQIIGLGNRITAFCPYFDYFGISTTIVNNKIKLYKNNTIAVQIYSNTEHRDFRSKSKFHDLVKGTNYDDYYLGDILKDLNIRVKSRNGLDYWCSFKTERGEGSIWYKNGICVISDTKRKDGHIYVDKMYNDLNGRECYLYNYLRFAGIIKTLYSSGNLFFENEKSYYIFEKIMMKISSR